MLLDNWLIVWNNEEEVDSKTSVTNCVGSSVPKSWLACFTKDNAMIDLEEGLWLKTTVGEALDRLDICVNYFMRKQPIKSNFNHSMLDEFLEIIHWLKDFDKDYIVGTFFGNYGDRVTLERFQNTCKAGEVSLYGDDEFILIDLNKK